MYRSPASRTLTFVYRLAILVSLAGLLGAQVGPRIVRRPDDGALLRVPGTTHPAISSARLIGRAPGSMPMDRMLLNLKSSAEQEAALEQLLAEQQDPSSPYYHTWVTPEQFGQLFGPAQQDVDAVTGWLQDHGFQVTEVAAGRRSIEFSGSARQVELAFDTQMNRYEWKGERHVANALDISIPDALAAVVGGVASLHDFGPRPLHHAVAPLANFGGTHGMAPYDFAAIYNVSSLWNAGFDGAGQTIAVVGQTNIKLSDVTGFRSMFGLPVNNPLVIVNGKDPGIVTADETEALLDVEWAGAVAKGATIKFVTSAGTNSSDGVTLSAQYIVNHALAPVMSVSYGLCEAQMGAANQFYNSLWQQAAAQGIAVFVASGDSGSAGCDVPYATSAGKNTTKAASLGFGVNGVASTAYNVAVGGTQFDDTASPATYWNAANDAHTASAKGYIPEIVWNESSYATGGSNNTLYAGGGGPSAVWPRPSWQSAPGVPSGTARLVPDVSLTAAGHDGYVIEQEGGLYLVGGTSAATPSFAGLMAIVNQYTHATNGNPNGKLYSLAARVPSVFHDVTGGNNAVPCGGGTPNCSTTAPITNIGKTLGYSAGAGYDLATGLGSVDAYAMVNNWGSVSAAPAITSLTPNPMIGSTSSQNLTITGAGFVAGSGLKVTVGATLFQGTQVTLISSSQLQVKVTVGTTAQSLNVQVTNPNGQASNIMSLRVTAAVVPPVITSLSPNPFTGSNSSQALTVNGTGFLAGARVAIGPATVVQAASVTATKLVANVVTGLSQRTYTIQVTNPDGGVSNSATLTVSAPVTPSITSLSPTSMTGSNSAQTLTINGTNFQSGTGLKVSVGSTTYSGSSLTFVSVSQLKVAAIVGVGAKSLSVQVTNPSGQVSKAATLTVK